MITEKAVVSRCEGQYVWVNTQRQSSCGHCSIKKACGTQVLAQVLGNKIAQVRCLNKLDDTTIKAGDQVLIGLQESALLTGSLLVYLLPLLMMIFFSGVAVFIAQIKWPEVVDLLAIIAALIGFIVGMLLVKNYLDKDSNKKLTACYQPVILKKISIVTPLILR
jgi:sigma-E factor negative regulatory protein RseC